MHDTHLPLRKWFTAIYLLCEAKKGMSAMQLKRTLGVAYKTAWYLCHRIREAMGNDPLTGPMAQKVALLTGITGQDGSYLTEFLLEKGYQVHGIVRRVALEDPDHHLQRISHVSGEIELHSGSLESFASLHRVIRSLRPDECYHLAAQSFVSYSFEDEFSTLNTNINGTHYVLAALHDIVPGCRFYFAGSSEMFGRAEEVPQSEHTRFHPRSVYGISKVAGFELTRNSTPDSN